MLFFTEKLQLIREGVRDTWKSRRHTALSEMVDLNICHQRMITLGDEKLTTNLTVGGAGWHRLHPLTDLRMGKQGHSCLSVCNRVCNVGPPVRNSVVSPKMNSNVINP